MATEVNCPGNPDKKKKIKVIPATIGVPLAILFFVAFIFCGKELSYHSDKQQAEKEGTVFAEESYTASKFLYFEVQYEAGFTGRLLAYGTYIASYVTTAVIIIVAVAIFLYLIYQGFKAIDRFDKKHPTGPSEDSIYG